MKRVTESQFISDYGFKSGSFVVDDAGNITAKSISIIDEVPDLGPGVISNFQVTNTTGDNLDQNYVTEGYSATGYVANASIDNFLFDNIVGTNPNIELTKTRTFIFDLALTTTGIFFLKEDKSTLYNLNLIHSSGDRNAAAQGKRTGTLSINIPADYNESIIFYSNESRTVFGEIAVEDPIGSFSILKVNSTTESVDLISGALTVAGGAAIAKTLRVGKSVNTDEIESNNNLILTAENEIQLVSNSITVGTINNSGLQINQINNTPIGITAPAQAVFTQVSFNSGTVNNSPINQNDLTNKAYVDTTITALSIALGS